MTNHGCSAAAGSRTSTTGMGEGETVPDAVSDGRVSTTAIVATNTGTTRPFIA